MKLRFSTLDIMAILPELKSRICTGWRLNQVYDCDYKTYIFKLNKSIVQMKKDDDPLSVNEETANKMSFIVESGIRIHTTDYDWPRSHAPGAFAIKLRRHLRNKRVEDIRQIGIDRVIDIQFGTNLAANHLIIELFDRGNLILTDNTYTILAVLRWRKPVQNQNKATEKNDAEDSENCRVGQVYPMDLCRKIEDVEFMTEDKIIELMNNSQSILASSHNYKKRNKAQRENEDFVEINLKDLFNSRVIYGSSLLEDKLLKHLSTMDSRITRCVIRIPLDGSKLCKDVVERYAVLIKSALDEAESVLQEVRNKTKSPGYIVQRTQQSVVANDIQGSKKSQSTEDKITRPMITNIDFFPILSCAERKMKQESGDVSCQEYDSFDKAVDVYFCSMESQKIDSKALSAEKEVKKKLENLKIAQEKRLNDLGRSQKDDEDKARLIELNCDKIEDALLIIRSMIANQISWKEIWTTILEAQAMKDPIASLITGVNFDRNEFTMKLSDPYEELENDSNKPKFKNVDIDISLSAYANARKFFVKRRSAVNKEKKAIEVSKKAYKNVERKTKEMLKEVVVKTNITKARKRYWFENFFWFISSDGYLVVAGRDAEQNELLVKRYMKNNDIYVHADLHGASSVIIKNEFSEPVPPKTLTEAGTMAVCYSSAWDSKIATTSWWVYPKQVSKTAPAGEYLTLGAFIIRGKKNYLPLSNLVLGFGFLFRLGEESIEKRKLDRETKESNLNHHNKVEISEDQTPNNDNFCSNSDTDEQSLEDSGETESESETTGRADGYADPPTNDESEITNKELGQETDVINDNLEDDDDIEEEGKASEYRLVDTITGATSPDDILLYAIPMCGPYTAFHSFKYKVKVIPGTNKRGKAAKACLGAFLHDKKASQREKDLLRALKDQDYARNIPNKVKISATNMLKLNKKKPKKSEVRLPM